MRRHEKEFSIKNGIKRSYHSIKSKEYLSIFGRVSIPRACYWVKGEQEAYPLDAELNLPEKEYSYLLQEWGVSLGVEEPYETSSPVSRKHFRNPPVGKFP